MTHPDHDITAPVEQCDRVAAEDALRVLLGFRTRSPNDGHYMVQAFAKHRLAAIEAQQAALAAKDSEIEKLRAVIYRYVDPCDIAPEDEAIVGEVSRAARGDVKS